MNCKKRPVCLLLAILLCIAMTLPASGSWDIGDIVQNGISYNISAEGAGDGWSFSGEHTELTLDNCKAESLDLFVQTNVTIILTDGSVNELDLFQFEMNYEISSLLTLVVKGNGMLIIHDLQGSVFSQILESPLGFITIMEGARVVIDDGTEATTYTDNKGWWLSSFSDVPNGAYYREAVEWAVTEGITKGVTETHFAPDDTCTRGQVATFLWRAKGCPEPATTDNPFTDVDPSSAFYKAILWAAENGVTTGTSDTTFSPGNPCTHAHVLTFLWRAEGKPPLPELKFDPRIADFYPQGYYPMPSGGIAKRAGEPFLADSFPPGYYTHAVRWAEIAGVLHSMSKVFTPSALCSRGDIVTYLYRNLA